MNKYRFILGKRVDDSVNLVTNGTFTGSLTGWSVSGSSFWTNVSNTANCSGSGAEADFARCKLTQANVVKPGNYYYLSYDLKKSTSGSATNNGRVTYSIGGTYYAPWEDYDQNSTTSFVTQVHENVFCGQGTSLVFFCHAFNNKENCAIDNVLLYPYVWNDPLDFEPIDWSKTKIIKKRDENLNGLVVEFISNVTFIEDGYDYLYAKYLSDGYCGEVPVRIEEYNSVTGIYEKYYEGIIFINQCKFSIGKKKVSVNILDSSASKIFADNSNVKVNPFPEQNFTVAFPYAFPTNYPSAGNFTLRSIDINNNSGTYSTGCSPSWACNVYDFLRKIVLVSTKYRLDFDSDFFSTGTFEEFCVSPGFYINGNQCDQIDDTKIFKLSMKELFSELNKLFDLSFSIDKSGAIPLIIIEPKIDYLNATPVFTISNINNLEFEFDENNTVKTINIGYEIIDASASGNGANNEDGVQYKTNNLCAKNELNLVSKFIQSSEVIKALNLPNPPTITHTKYDNNWVWLETDGTQTVNSGSGTYDLNPNIDADDNMSRHVKTLQGTVFQSTNNTPDIVTKTNTHLPLIYSFEYPITKAQFDLIEQAYDTISFSETDTEFKDGFLLEAEYEIGTGITKFKLLSK